MIVTIEIKNDLAPSVLEVLKLVKGITIKSINDKKISRLSDIRDAYIQTERAEKGDIHLKTFDELMHELKY